MSLPSILDRLLHRGLLDHDMDEEMRSHMAERAARTDPVRALRS